MVQSKDRKLQLSAGKDRPPDLQAAVVSPPTSPWIQSRFLPPQRAGERER
uniref:Uncharacterized protein n=1 Tax=Arundo donax TaxID=35708 RepID=A0A0A9C7X8_ARUDO